MAKLKVPLLLNLYLLHLPALDAMPALETAVCDTNFTVSQAAFTTLCHRRRADG